MSEQMKAVVMHETGDASVLKLEDVDKPEPIPTEVLVKVAAVGLNPVDYKTRGKGGLVEVMGGFPVILGWDVAGTVEAVGGGVTRFEEGDRVFGMPWFPRQAGGYAEYVTAPSRQLVRTPDKLSDEQAAALPLAGLTAWQALVDTAGVKEGDRVLVHAASGGVGHLAVQIAKNALGAYVIGTARAEKHDFLKDLGVDEVIDYTQKDFEKEVEGVDVVLDLVGGDDYGLRSIETLADDGLLIAVPGGVSDAVQAAANERGVRATGILVEPDGLGLGALAQLVQGDWLRVFVEESFPLAQAGEAHERLEYGRARGKLVLTI